MRQATIAPLARRDEAAHKVHKHKSGRLPRGTMMGIDDYATTVLADALSGCAEPSPQCESSPALARLDAFLGRADAPVY